MGRHKQAGVATVFKYRCVIFSQYFSVQRSCQLRLQDETCLVLAEQPTDPRVFVRNTVVLTKGLAPAPEVGSIALEFIFMHHDECDIILMCVFVTHIHTCAKQVQPSAQYRLP